MVLALLSLAFGAVMLTMPGGQVSLEREAERLSAAARHARDEAVMVNRATALRIDPTGFAFEQRRAGRWSSLEAPPHARQSFPEGVVARWEGDAASVRVTYDPLGGTTPVELWLVSAGRRQVVRFDAGGEGVTHAAR